MTEPENQAEALDRKALEAGASAEAAIDGRDFAALGKSDKERYISRFSDGIRAYLASLPEAPAVPVVKPLEWDDGMTRTPAGDLYAVLGLSKNVWTT